MILVVGHLKWNCNLVISKQPTALVIASQVDLMMDQLLRLDFESSDSLFLSLTLQLSSVQGLAFVCVCSVKVGKKSSFIYLNFNLNYIFFFPVHLRLDPAGPVHGDELHLLPSPSHLHVRAEPLEAGEEVIDMFNICLHFSSLFLNF